MRGGGGSSVFSGVTGASIAGSSSDMQQTCAGGNGANARKMAGQIDVQGDDICEALAQLAIGHMQNKQLPRQGIVKMCPILEEVHHSEPKCRHLTTLTPCCFLSDTTLQARVLAESLPQAFGLDFKMPTLNPLSGPDSPNRAQVAALLAQLPPQHLADAGSNFYNRFMDSFFHPLHVPTFQLNTVKLREQARLAKWDEVDLFFVATYLAVVALGTQTMSAVGESGDIR